MRRDCVHRDLVSQVNKVVFVLIYPEPEAEVA